MVVASLTTAKPRGYRTSMYVKPVILAFLAACGLDSKGATTDPSEQPDKLPPDPPEEAGYIFCCQDVDPKTASGQGCVTIGEKQIDQCSTVLACGEKFTKKDGTVTCL